MTSNLILSSTGEIAIKAGEKVLEAIESYFDYKKEVAVSKGLEYQKWQRDEIIKQTGSQIEVQENNYLKLLNLKDKFEEVAKKDIELKEQELIYQQEFFERSKKSLDNLELNLNEERKNNPNSVNCRILEKIYRSKLLAC